MKVLIIAPNSKEKISIEPQVLEKLADIREIVYCNSAIKGLNRINLTKPDLVILPEIIEGMSSSEFLQMAQHKPAEHIITMGVLNSNNTTVGVEQSEQKIIVCSQHSVYTNEIAYIKAQRAYCSIYTKQGNELIATRAMAYFEKLLKGDDFVKPHKSYLVNKNYIANTCCKKNILNYEIKLLSR